MWKILATLLLCVTPALAQERVTAYDALRVVGVHLNRDAVNHVISVTGVDGSPQPETWKILLDEPRARGGVREKRKTRDDQPYCEPGVDAQLRQRISPEL